MDAKKSTSEAQKAASQAEESCSTLLAAAKLNQIKLETNAMILERRFTLQAQGVTKEDLDKLLPLPS